MKPAFDAGAHQQLGICQRDVMGRDWNVVLVRFVDDREIQFRRQLLRAAISIVDPDLDELRFDFDIVADSLPRLRHGGDGIRHVCS